MIVNSILSLRLHSQSLSIPLPGTPMYDYSDDDMDSLLSDEDGLGLAEGDELMILDSGFGGFDLS